VPRKSILSTETIKLFADLALALHDKNLTEDDVRNVAKAAEMTAPGQAELVARLKEARNSLDTSPTGHLETLVNMLPDEVGWALVNLAKESASALVKKHHNDAREAKVISGQKIVVLEATVKALQDDLETERIKSADIGKKLTDADVEKRRLMKTVDNLKIRIAKLTGQLMELRPATTKPIEKGRKTRSAPKVPPTA
jgi:hypothetical protein